MGRLHLPLCSPGASGPARLAGRYPPCLRFSPARCAAASSGKQNDVADRMRVGEQHGQPVDTNAFAGGRRQAVSRAPECSRGPVLSALPRRLAQFAPGTGAPVPPDRSTPKSHWRFPCRRRKSQNARPATDHPAFAWKAAKFRWENRTESSAGSDGLRRWFQTAGRSTRRRARSPLAAA